MHFFLHIILYFNKKKKMEATDQQCYTDIHGKMISIILALQQILFLH